MCQRLFFFFLRALRHDSRQPIRAEQQLRPRQAATDTLIFLKSEAAPSRTPPVTLPPAAPPTKGSCRHISSHRQIVANSTRRFLTRESTS